MTDRDHLAALIAALDASPRALRREECRGELGEWIIAGKSGHVIADGAAFLMYVTTQESPRRWVNVKRRLASFCRVTQDGDAEGCLHLDHLPTRSEANAIRNALGIRQRRHLSREAKAKAIVTLERSRASLNRPLAA
jgi:hypothetical protein